MFLVHVSFDERAKKVERLLTDGEPEIAVLVAAADFERTLRRAIIALSLVPTTDVREAIEGRYNSVTKYGAAWTHFVRDARQRTFSDVVPHFDDVKRSFNLRNQIIHGEVGTCSPEYAAQCARSILGATRSVVAFSEECGVNLCARLQVRRRPRLS